MSADTPIDPALARTLVLDELFDLSLYERLRTIAQGDLRRVLDQLIPLEREHVAFWQDFLGVKATALGAGRRFKLGLLVAVCRLFGAPAIQLVLQAIEVYGVRKYLAVWRSCEGTPFEPTVRGILEDEFEHEDAVVTGEETLRMAPDRVRNIFLGLNDGLVEILGAVSGFFGAFDDALIVLMAGSTTAVAGALSMAAGAWVATSSELEVRETERTRQRFLGEPEDADHSARSPLTTALVVGVSYLAGALVPMVPVATGAQSAFPSVLVAGAVIVVVSMGLAFLSGMNIRRRVLTNLLIIAAAAAISYGIGNLAQAFWGIAP